MSSIPVCAQTTTVREPDPPSYEDSHVDNFKKSVQLTDMITEKDTEENIMFSPISLNFALGMLMEGADGDTKKDLEEYLGSDEFSYIVSDYMNHLEDYNSDEASLNAYVLDYAPD